MSQSTIGADPELLLYSAGLKKFIPSIGLIGGSKNAPLVIHNGALQEDNVTAEFNIDPVSTEDSGQFIESIKSVRKYLDALVAPFELVTAVESSAEYDEEMLQHPQAMESGCDPDMNVYNMERNVYPRIDSSNVRCAGGHIHYGSDEIFQDPGSRERFIKLCDFYVGAPLALIDKSTARKQTYGKAGNFRYKPYGVEYRTPSNIWLKSEKLMDYVFNGMKRAEQALVNGDLRQVRASERIISTCISSGHNRHLYDVLDRAGRTIVKEFA